MGLKEMFFGGAEGRRKRHIARARNKDAQSADRFASLDALRDDASDEAIAGLLGRFTIRYDKSIEDEQEKDFVYECLVKMGERVLPELQKHLRSADSIAWGLKILTNVTSIDKAWPILADLCERNDNTYTRDPSKKIQILHHLGDLDDKRCTEALVPYHPDIDAGVRYVAVEGLIKHKTPEIARDPLLQLLVSGKEPSRRIMTRVAEGFVDLGWDVKGHTGTIEKLVADLLPGGRVDGQGKIKRKA